MRIALVTIAIAMFIAPAASAQPFTIPWYTIDSGGGTSSGGSFTLSGTIGQPDAGQPMTGGSFTLTGGFWAGVAATTNCVADFNNDGEVNFFDVAEFLTAFNTGDPSADLTGDGEINYFDVAEFLTQFAAGCA